VRRSEERPLAAIRFFSGFGPAFGRPVLVPEGGFMAYDRYDTRNDPRGDRSRWQNERSEDRGWDRDRSSRDDRGFFERAGDEIASWFGDDDADRRRRQDQRHEGPEVGRGRFVGRDRDIDHGQFWRDRSWDSGDFEDEDRSRRFAGRSSGYRPMTGDYGRSEAAAWRSQEDRWTPRRGRFSARDDDRLGYSQSDRFQDTSFAGSRIGRTQDHDPNYSSWRNRHMDELDRDYDDYRRENQSRFEDDFGNWRQRRQEKRGLLGQVREHMEVVGSDDQHVGTIDRVAGDRIILTKSDPESGGVHHSISCSDIDKVEGDRIVLDCKADEARNRWRDESRSRALFEREDQGEMGPRILDRSFEGTYR